MLQEAVFLFVYRIEQRLYFREVAQDGVRIGLGHRERRYGLVCQIKEISLAFLPEGVDLVDVHDVLSVASDKSAALETFLDGLQTASEHILLEFTLAVGIPYLDIVVV